MGNRDQRLTALGIQRDDSGPAKPDPDTERLRLRACPLALVNSDVIVSFRVSGSKGFRVR